MRWKWQAYHPDGLPTNQLIDLLYRNLPSLCPFAVRAADDLPTKRLGQRPIAIIVNTDVSSREGSHWTALYIPSAPSHPEFFCSGGGDMPETVDAFFTRQGARRCHTLYSEDLIQDPFSNTCGMFCVDFLAYRANHAGTIYDYVGRFRRDSYEYNERELTRFWNARDDVSSLTFKALDAPDSTH